MSKNPNQGNDNYNPDEGNYEVSDFTNFNPDAYLSKRARSQSQSPAQSQPQSPAQAQPYSQPYSQPQSFAPQSDAAMVDPDEAAPLEGFDVPISDTEGFSAPKYAHLKGSVPGLEYNPLTHSTPLMRMGIIMYGCAMIGLAVALCICNLSMGIWMLQR